VAVHSFEVKAPPRQRGRVRPRALALACLPLLFAGCVQVRLERDLRLEPLPKSALRSLAPGITDFAAALERLGPPVFAWELPDDGIALAWGWFRAGGWQMKIALPDTGNGESIYIDYGHADEHMRGAVLFFDRRLVLTSVREGMLRDLRQDPRARPAVEEDAEQGAGR
jgi:hypothetical protein